MEQLSPIEFFNQRMDALGVQPKDNSIDLWQFSTEENKNVLVPTPIFTANSKGIEILLYTLGRGTVRIDKNGSNQKQNYTVTRIANPTVNEKTGDIAKYQMPKGHATMPFFPPALVKAYDNKTPIPVLYLTEGYFKAFKAQLHGINCIGLPSITCMRDRTTGKLHGDILKLVQACNVQRLVWLTDGDCRDITAKEVIDGIDLSRRPTMFYNSISTFYDLCSIFDGNVELYFAHIHSRNFDDKPKGLDDLLIAYPGEIKKIKKEAESFDTIHEGIYPGNYFVKMKITYGVGKVHKYFMLHNIDVFFHHHVEFRPEIKTKEFKFYGTLYKYNDDDKVKSCEIITPGEAKDYFRVGDTYYRYVDIPIDEHGHCIKTFRPRAKGTIVDDFGKGFIKHIPKYTDECIVPDHKNYQRVIGNCFNMYHPFIHEPAEGECDTILSFFKHIFGEHPIDIINNDGQKRTIPYYELGLDYFTILYRYPQQILPVLCLVSKENGTGKTTMVNFLKYCFGENVADIGNSDLASDFNAHWAGKLIVAIQEAMIEKAMTVEKVKALSTGNEVMVNAKGANQVAKKFFAKFIFCSNNEDTFIRIGDDDKRYWVIKVPVIPKDKLNLDMEKDMQEELPAFLHFIENRKIVTERQYRHWFNPDYLITEALRKVQKNSLPAIQKKLELELENLFAATELQSITIPLKAIAKELLRRPDDTDYIKRVLHNMGYKTLPLKRNTSYPRLEEESITELGSKTPRIKTKVVPVEFFTTYYEFMRDDFLTSGTVENDGTEAENETDKLPF